MRYEVALHTKGAYLFESVPPLTHGFGAGHEWPAPFRSGEGLSIRSPLKHGPPLTVKSVPVDQAKEMMQGRSGV